MGMYTEFHFNASLKKGTPEGVLNVLRYMVGDIEDRPQNLPDHDLFKTQRWWLMLVCNSYYFDADTHSTLRFDDINDSHYL